VWQAAVSLTDRRWTSTVLLLVLLLVALLVLLPAAVLALFPALSRVVVGACCVYLCWKL
jgi:hypothetical protein